MRWFRRLFRKEAVEKQLDAELRFHIEQQISDYIAEGMNPTEARRRAQAEFGGVERVKEECRVPARRAAGVDPHIALRHE